MQWTNVKGNLVQGMLLAIAVCLALVSILGSVTGELRFQRGNTFVVSIAPGRALVMDVWPVAILSEHFSPFMWSHSYTDLKTNDRWVGVWYQNTTLSMRWRLAAFTVPTWPLTTATALAWLVLLTTTAWMRLRRLRQPHAGHHLVHQSLPVSQEAIPHGHQL